MCTWGSRHRYSWLCLGCVSAKTASDDDIRPLAPRAQEVHVQEARSVFASAAASRDSADGGRGAEELEEEQARVPVMHPTRDDTALPPRAWWQRLEWRSALRTGVSAFVQVPDRFRGAVTHARRNALEVLEKASRHGEATAEWKTVLFFDLVLFARPRGAGPACAELLEERLALLWGGQSA